MYIVPGLYLNVDFLCSTSQKTFRIPSVALQQPLSQTPTLTGKLMVLLLQPNVCTVANSHRWNLDFVYIQTLFLFFLKMEYIAVCGGCLFSAGRYLRARKVSLSAV